MEQAKRPSILIIEDNAISRDVLKLLFQKRMGINIVDEWVDSDRFMEKLCSLANKPDLIIMDIIISPIDGFEMITQLRADPQFADVKVIAHTASVMKEQISRMKTLGFDGLISKPITREIFPELIRRVMAGEDIWYVS